MASKFFLGGTRLLLDYTISPPLYPPNVGDALTKDHSFTYGGHVPQSKISWKEVHHLTTQNTTYQIDVTPAQMLLHHSIPKKDYHLSLSLQLLNAAKMCSPILWKSSKPPTIADWIRHINKVAEMEELVHQAKDTPTKFMKIWSCWHHFQMTDEYSQLLS